MLKLVALIFATTACASTYEFTSEPEGVQVFSKTPQGKALLGTTPFEYAKSGLPSDAPFSITAEKTGFRSTEFSIMPQDNSRTHIALTLKSENVTKGDEGLSRLRTVMTQVFLIQENVQKKQFADALRKLELLETQEPALPEIYVLKGSVYLLLKERKQARKMWEKALQLDPSLDSIKVRLDALDEGGSRVSTPQ